MFDFLDSFYDRAKADDNSFVAISIKAYPLLLPFFPQQ